METLNARQFAARRSEAWNSRNLDTIMALYADEITLTSPIAKALTQ